MEKERGREGRGRRGGVEMRKGIVIGGMVLGLLMGCNNGGEERLAAEKRLSEIGKSAENTFYSFLNLVADTLGFKVTAETTRDKVKDYFTGLANGVEKTIQALVEIGNKMQQPSGDDQKSVSVESLNQGIESAKNTLETLKGHLESLKDIVGDSGKVVEDKDSQDGAADESAVDKAHKALKGIVEIAKTQKVEEPKSNDVTIVTANIGGGANPEYGAKTLTKGAATGDAGPGAVAIVSAVNGEAILAAIFGSPDNDAALAGGTAKVGTSALAFAKGGTTPGNLAQTAAKASSVAGGIALRSLTKGGKLASHSTHKDGKAVQSAGITAVNKLLGAVENIISKTVKNVLNKAKTEIDKARDSKVTVKQ